MSPDSGAQEQPSAIFIGHEIFRHSRYGSRHPLAIPRVSTVMDLVRALDWLPPGRFCESPRATPEQLARFHDPDYVATLIEVERTQRLDPERQQRYRLGSHDNPIFGEIFSRPATAAGGTLLAADLVRHGGIVHNPAGGTHHGRPDRAAGFCYLNDPVLGLLALRDQGLAPLLYVDLDAHHGDGVEDAFATDPTVVTLSIHEGRRWPHSGGFRADPAAGIYSLPLPRRAGDADLAMLIDAVVLPLAVALRPAALILQCGADGLIEDPLSRLAYSNRGLWQAVAQLKSIAPRVIVLGGGGYNPWSVARCWTGIWAVLNGFTVPEPLPPPAEAVLRALTWRHRDGRDPPAHWFTTLADRACHDPVSDDTRALVARCQAAGWSR